MFGKMLYLYPFPLVQCIKVHLNKPEILPVNLFTAPACKIYRVKDAQTRLKNSIVSGLITNLFPVLCILIKIISLASANNFCTFISHFQVMGLKVKKIIH